MKDIAPLRVVTLDPAFDGARPVGINEPDADASCLVTINPLVNSLVSIHGDTREYKRTQKALTEELAHGIQDIETSHLRMGHAAFVSKKPMALVNNGLVYDEHPVLVTAMACIADSCYIPINDFRSRRVITGKTGLSNHIGWIQHNTTPVYLRS